MTRSQTKEFPLISVIIPCYNHEKFLPEAIDSVLAQQYSPCEIIVVDDGSTDSSRAVCESYPGLKYIYQANQGLSAARNTGIDNCNGDYLVFLDADDWLLPNAFSTNLRYLQAGKNIAFAAGAHIKVNEHKKLINEGEKKFVSGSFYCYLLEDGNYLEMIATLMFQRWAFRELRFDVSLRACEDYDVYLKITRNHPIIRHKDPVAVYRMHGSNMSQNILLMLESALKALMQQESQLRNEDEKQCYRKGILFWRNYYARLVYLRTRHADSEYRSLHPQKIRSRQYLDKLNTLFKGLNKRGELTLLWRHNKPLYLKYMVFLCHRKVYYVLGRMLARFRPA